MDDLQITFGAGNSAYVQSKASLSLSTAKESPFVKAVEQIVNQATSGLGPDDRLVLLTQSASGPIRHLAQALDRKRDRLAGLPSGDEAEALQRFENLLKGLDTGTKEALLKALHILVLDLTTEGAGDRGVAEAYLDTPTDGNGRRAFRVLNFRFREAAVLRTGVDLERGRRFLEEDGIPSGAAAGSSWFPASDSDPVIDYRAHIRSLDSNTRKLVDREAELARLGEVARVAAPSVMVVVGEPWAGKTALLARFAANPPEDCDVVAFFIREVAAENTRTHFLSAVNSQLIQLAGRRGSLPSDPDRLRMQFAALWQEACSRSSSARRLILVVDGLDEQSTHPGRSVTPLIPLDLTPHVGVILSSRANPAPLDQLVGPVSATPEMLPLTARSDESHDRAAALQWVQSQARHPDDLAGRCLGLLEAANSGLSFADLAELTGRSDALAVSSALGPMQRFLVPVPHRSGMVRYVFAHVEVLRSVRTVVGDAGHLSNVDRIVDWVEDYRGQGWPARTPHFMADGLDEMLLAADKLDLACEVVLDRPLSMSLRATGSYRRWRQVVHTCQETLQQRHRVGDVLTAVRLDLKRQELDDRSRAWPDAAAAALVRAGRLDTAVDLAMSVADSHGREAMLAAIVREAAQGDPYQALDLAKTIRNPYAIQTAVPAVVATLGPIELAPALDLVETVLDRSSDQLWPQVGLAGLLAILQLDAGIDLPSDLTGRAVAIAESGTSVDAVAGMLSSVASAIWHRDPDFAFELQERAESLVADLRTSSIPEFERIEVGVNWLDHDEPRGRNVLLNVSPPSLDLGLLKLVEHVGPSDPVDALALSQQISRPNLRAQAMAGVLRHVEPSSRVANETLPELMALLSDEGVNGCLGDEFTSLVEGGHLTLQEAADLARSANDTPGLASLARHVASDNPDMSESLLTDVFELVEAPKWSAWRLGLIDSYMRTDRPVERRRAAARMQPSPGYRTTSQLILWKSLAPGSDDAIRVEEDWRASLEDVCGSDVLDLMHLAGALADALGADALHVIQGMGTPHDTQHGLHAAVRALAVGHPSNAIQLIEEWGTAMRWTPNDSRLLAGSIARTDVDAAKDLLDYADVDPDAHTEILFAIADAIRDHSLDPNRAFELADAKVDASWLGRAAILSVVCDALSPADALAMLSRLEYQGDVGPSHLAATIRLAESDAPAAIEELVHVAASGTYYTNLAGFASAVRAIGSGGVLDAVEDALGVSSVV